MTVHVLTLAEAADLLSPVDNPTTNPIPPAEESTGQINLNTANKDTLDLLYGIGPILAQAIIDYRAENGPFATIEDIMLVTGIKESVYEQIKDDITV
jgi:competence protein ComEA